MPPFDEFFPFDKGYGAPANATRWRKMARLFMPDGRVMAGPEHLTDLTAAVVGGQITVQPGAITVHGYYAELHNPVTFAVLTTGMVVAGIDLVNEVVNLYYKDLVTDVSGLTQTDTLWETPLWLITGGALGSFVGATVNPGRGLATALSNSGTWYNVNPSSSVTFNLGTFRVTHPSLCLYIATLQVLTVNAAYAQDALGQIVIQSGLPDVQLSTNYELFYFPGGGGINMGFNFRITTSLTFLAWMNTPGKKTAGIKVTAGGGTTVQAANMSVNILQVGSLANV